MAVAMEGEGENERSWMEGMRRGNGGRGFSMEEMKCGNGGGWRE